MLAAALSLPMPTWSQQGSDQAGDRAPGLALRAFGTLGLARSSSEHVQFTRDLSQTDVVNIFMGRFREFPSGISAQPIGMPASATRTQFYRTLVKKEPAEINAYWARLVFAGRTSPPIQADSPGDALRILRANQGGIAYMERSQVTSREKIVFELPAP